MNDELVYAGLVDVWCNDEWDLCLMQPKHVSFLVLNGIQVFEYYKTLEMELDLVRLSSCKTPKDFLKTEKKKS